MKRTLASLALTFFVGGSMLVGCGSDGTETTGGGTPTKPIALENLSQELAQSYCELAFSCCTSMEQTELFDGFPTVPKTVEECSTTFKEFYDMFVLGGFKASVDAGRLKYDGALAAKCLATTDGQCSSLNSEGISTGGESCDAVFVGLVPDGGECGGSNDCAVAGSWCSMAPGGMLGKCQPEAKEGESCAETDCADGLVCDFGAMTEICIKPLADGQMCSSDLVCVSEVCDLASGLCVPKKAVGESCSGFYHCKDSYCDFSTSLCTAKKDDGAACMSFDECKSDECTADKCGSSAQICDGI